MTGEPRCKGCDRPIVWAYVDGKSVPLDSTAPVYHRMYDPDSGKHFYWLDQKDTEGKRAAMVSHFAVCPARDQFSGRSRK